VLHQYRCIFMVRCCHWEVINGVCIAFAASSLCIVSHLSARKCETMCHTHNK
jgi:hypothetical protein